MRKFADWLRREGYADRTVTQYVRTLVQIERATRSPIAQLGWEQLRAWSDTTPLNHSARARLRNAVSAYWRSLGRKLPRGAIRVPRRPEMPCRALELDQVETVLAAARLMPARVYAAVCLTYYAALRRFEVCELEWDRIGDEWLWLVGKGDKEARLPVHPLLREALAVLPRRGRFVFASRGSHIADGTLNLWFAAIRLATGVPVSAHVMRHTALTEANDRSQDLRAVQTFARHSDPRTTAGYTRTKAAALRAVVDCL